MSENRAGPITDPTLDNRRPLSRQDKAYQAMETTFQNLQAKYPGLSASTCTDGETYMRLVATRHGISVHAQTRPKSSLLLVNIHHLDRGEFCLHRHADKVGSNHLVGFHGLVLTKYWNAERMDDGLCWDARLHLSGKLVETGYWMEMTGGGKYFEAIMHPPHLEVVMDALMNAPDRAHRVGA